MLALSCRSRLRRAFLRRCYLTAVTFTSSGQGSASSLIAHLERTSPSSPLKSSSSSSPPVDPSLSTALDAPAVTLFALSQGVPDLPRVLHAIHARYPTAVGCLSSSPSPSSSADTHSLALAHFHADEHESYVAFRSTVAGRQATSVGHWRPPGEVLAGERAAAGGTVDEGRLELAFNGGDWGALWGDEARGSQATETAALEGLESVDPADVAALIAFATAPSASPLLQQARGLYPGALTAGLVAPPTPFATGRPHTLFWQGEAVETGAVGVARLTKRGQGADWEVRSGWAGLEPVRQGEQLVVDSCQGNLLLSLQPAADVNPNPTRHLLSLLSSAHLPPLGKDKDFFLGFLDAADDRALRRVVRILSGDPSRGGMALGCEESLETGDRVTFLHRPDSATAQPDAAQRRVPALEFSHPIAEQVDRPLDDGAQDGVFQAASDDGVLVRTHVEGVAGAWVTVSAAPASR